MDPFIYDRIIFVRYTIVNMSGMLREQIQLISK